MSLQRNENLLATEYINLVTCIDSLYLLITKQQSTNEYFKKMVEQLLTETNYILNLTQEEISNISEKVKDIRRYFVHSNKTQKEKVSSNVSIIQLLVTIFIEIIRARIMMEIGIDKKIIENYYKDVKQLENVKYDIVNNVNEDEEIPEGEKIMNALSKKDREDIAELNAIMGTRYREVGYNLENPKDLIEIVESVTAECMDYNHYYMLLDDVVENFDQSLEVFHPEKWFKVGKKGTTDDGLIDETIISIRDASNNMFKLVMKTEEKCKELWEILLLGDKEEAKEYFIGKDLKYTKEEALESIEEVIENIFDIDYNNQVEEDAQSFAKAIKESLEEIIRGKNESDNN